MPQFSPSKRVRIALSVLILVVTFSLFGYYIVTNPDKVIQPLLGLGLATVGLVILGYMGVTLTNSLILKESLKVLHTPYSLEKSFLLTAYSSIVNFFGPLQSGPGFRALYLKQKLGVKLRDFTATLVVYYIFFGLINVAVIGAFLVMQTGLLTGIALALLAFGALTAALLLLWKKVPKTRFKAVGAYLLSKQAAAIFLFTLFQCGLMAGIYFAELLTVNPGISLTQALLYTAVANLTLFVALTPGAIGIRESFLLFSQQLHGIDQQTVIAASVIDRALYFVVLGLLFLVSISLHTKKRLTINKNIEPSH